MKLVFASILFLFAITTARAVKSDDPEGSLLRYIAAGKLTAQRAAQHAPADQFGYLRDEHEYTYVGSIAYQMNAEAVFFAEYAKQLKTLTDKKNPAAAETRKHLIALLESASDFLVDLNHRRNYNSDRIPGFAEWLLYSADPNFFHPHKEAPLALVAAEASFTANDVRLFIKAIGLARFDSTHTFKVNQMIDEWSDKIMANLTVLEQHLNETGKRHFRFQLVRFIDNPGGALYDR